MEAVVQARLDAMTVRATELETALLRMQDMHDAGTCDIDGGAGCCCLTENEISRVQHEITRLRAAVASFQNAPAQSVISAPDKLIRDFGV